jgi:hypothetical protein
MKVTLTVGDRVYNHGDMANSPHFGTVSEVISDRWGVQYRIKPDDGSDRSRDYTIPAVMIDPVFKGHSGTRIVPESAYLAWREAQQQGMSAARHSGMSGDGTDGEFEQHFMNSR